MAVSRALIDALAQRARRRAKRRGLQAPKFPRAQELTYVKELRDLSREVSDLIRERVLPLLEPVRTDAETKPVPIQIVRVIESLRVQVGERVSARAPTVAGKMVLGTSDASRKALNDSYERVIGLRPWDSDDSLRGLKAQKIRENVDLISSIPNRQLDQVQAVISEGISAGTRVETIREQIEERFQVSESRAELIARDQVGKINADLNQERQEQIGVTSYTWESSNDERVRERHRELDGTRHTWDNPPVTNDQGDRNHPGGDFQCRCNSIADIDGLLERLGI